MCFRSFYGGISRSRFNWSVVSALSSKTRCCVDAAELKPGQFNPPRRLNLKFEVFGAAFTNSSSFRLSPMIKTRALKTLKFERSKLLGLETEPLRLGLEIPERSAALRATPLPNGKLISTMRRDQMKPDRLDSRSIQDSSRERHGVRSSDSTLGRCRRDSEQKFGRVPDTRGSHFNGFVRRATWTPSLSVPAESVSTRKRSTSSVDEAFRGLLATNARRE